MNKQELIDAILANKEAGIESKAAAARAVDAVLDGIAAGIKKAAATRRLAPPSRSRPPRPSASRPVLLSRLTLPRARPRSNFYFG